MTPRAGHVFVPLAIVLTIGMGIRLAYFTAAVSSPGYSWEDPDGYMVQAVNLVRDGDWRWTFDAVTYDIEGRRHALPPGYSVFLSFFALFPGFPLTAQVAQVLLAGVAMLLIYDLGRLVHSRRAGLMAAAGFAVWVPNIFNVWSTSQETLYVPLILASFVLFGRALAGGGGMAMFAAAGLAFGVSALTRSMPLFFVVPAALVHVAIAPDRRRALPQAAAFLAAFLLLTVPYTIALSRAFGRLAVIDTHGSIHQHLAPGEDAPGMLETAGAIWSQAAAQPVVFATGTLARARTLFYVNGGRILQIYVVAGSRTSAAIWKALVHTGTDLLLIVSVVLAPLGAVLCREWRLAAVLLVWTGVNVVIASLGGFGGARLRAPFEPLLLILAAVVLSRGWHRPAPIAVAAGLLVSVGAAFAVVPQVGRSLASWPDYGVRWPSIFQRDAGEVAGAAGINVPTSNGFVQVEVTTTREDAGSSAPVRVASGMNNVFVGTVLLQPGETRPIRMVSPRTPLVLLQLDAREPDGSPATIHVRVAR
jgi:4-amino-4-deoxy-L-arabinose transferase-like glycosyltransferase